MEAFCAEFMLLVFRVLNLLILLSMASIWRDFFPLQKKVLWKVRSQKKKWKRLLNIGAILNGQFLSRKVEPFRPPVIHFSRFECHSREATWIFCRLRVGKLRALEESRNDTPKLDSDPARKADMIRSYLINPAPSQAEGEFQRESIMNGRIN